MSEERKDEQPDRGKIQVEEFSEFTSQRPPDPPPSKGSGLRGCAIALGIAALLFLFVVGTCFAKSSPW